MGGRVRCDRAGRHRERAGRIAPALWCRRSMTPATLLLVVISAICYCVIADEPAGAPAAWQTDTAIVDGIAYARRCPLALEVSVVAGADGEWLRAGEEGWLVIGLLNTTDVSLRIHTFLEAGKGWKAKAASYHSAAHYSGFGLASLVAEFHQAGGARVCRRPLGPPDTPLDVQPHGRVVLCRAVRGPSAPGLYRLRVVLDTSDVLRAASTLNNLAFEDIGPALKAETTIAEVRVAPPRGFSWAPGATHRRVAARRVGGVLGTRRRPGSQESSARLPKAVAPAALLRDTGGMAPSVRGRRAYETGLRP